MDYSRFLNRIGAARKPSNIIALGENIVRSPKPTINLAIGLPNASMYPFESITVRLRGGQQVEIEGDLLTAAMQYGHSDGYPKLVKELTEYQKRLHNPPMTRKWRVAITTGIQDAMCKAFEMMINEGDNVLAEEYLYPATLDTLKPYKVNHLIVKGDQDGILPDSLRTVLSRWKPEEIKNPKSSVPKILYTVPNGSNPAGTSISAARRKEIYQIAQEYNLLIFEDDPYYFLSFGKKDRIPSFLSLDVDGRVLRFDSFSKIISGGIRVGYVTGSDYLVNRIVLHIQVSNLNCSSTSQVLVHETISRWGFDNFIQHVDRIAQFYESRRDKFLFYAQKWLEGLAEWTIPSAGMFIWIRILGVKDTFNLINDRLLNKHVAFLPGKFCTMNEVDTPYLRASFSLATDEEMDRGLQALAECIREELNA